MSADPAIAVTIRVAGPMGSFIQVTVAPAMMAAAPPIATMLDAWPSSESKPTTATFAHRNTISTLEKARRKLARLVMASAPVNGIGAARRQLRRSHQEGAGLIEARDEMRIVRYGDGHPGTTGCYKRAAGAGHDVDCRCVSRPRCYEHRDLTTRRREYHRGREDARNEEAVPQDGEAVERHARASGNAEATSSDTQPSVPVGGKRPVNQPICKNTKRRRWITHHLR